MLNQCVNKDSDGLHQLSMYAGNVKEFDDYTTLKEPDVIDSTNLDNEEEFCSGEPTKKYIFSQETEEE